MSQTVRPANPTRAAGAPTSGKSATGKSATGKSATGKGSPGVGKSATGKGSPGGAGPAPEQVEEPSVQLGDALEWLWRFFVSRRTGLVLILALGLMSLVGTLLEQAPAEVRADPQAYAGWLDSVRPKYGGWITVLDHAGGFAAFSSWWFKGTLVLLSTSIIACSIHRIPLLRKRSRPPVTRPPEAFFDRAPLTGTVPSGQDAPVALERATEQLRRSHYRTTSYPGPGGRGGAVCADRFRWSPFGSIAAHLGFVVVLVGAFLSATTGFKDGQFTAPVGSRVEVGHGTGLSVEAMAFSDAYYDDGSPKDYASDLVVYRQGRAVARQTVRVNQPLSVDGVSFYQSFFGTAASIRVADGQGKTLSDTAVPLTWRSDDGKHTIGQLNLPAKQLTVYVVMPASGEVDPTIQAGQVQLEVYQAGSSSPVATQVISQGKPLTIGGLAYTFVRERQFTGLIVARDPGVWLVWTGSLFLVGGIFLVFFFPHRRIWLTARSADGPGSVLRVAAKAKRDTAFEPQFRAVVAGLERSADRPSQDADAGPVAGTRVDTSRK
jgi:cytochrome c biogenesis protein